MQTANIKLGELYALRDGPEMVRFKVTAIDTHTSRDARNPKGKTTNTIHGVIEEGDLPDTKLEDRQRTVSPDTLEGHYFEYAALKAKQAKEDEIKQGILDREQILRERLRNKLYEVTGLHRPERPKGEWTPYHEPFSTPYSHTNQIVIGGDAMESLLEALELQWTPAGMEKDWVDT